MDRLWLRFGLFIYALLYTTILPVLLGIQDSWSDYHGMEPIIFPIATIGVSLGLWMHRSNEWKLPAFLLVIVALFNHEYWPIIHNTSAILFFIASTLIMIRDNKFKWFGIISVIGYPLLFLRIDEYLFAFEILQIPLIVLYHGSRVYRLLRLKLITKEKVSI